MLPAIANLKIRNTTDLILRRRVSAVSKDGCTRSPWFETRDDALLTMRPRSRRSQKNRRKQGFRRFYVDRYTTTRQAFIAALTASAVIGSERTRAPLALKIALPIAGAITVTAGSPTPVAFSPLAMTLMATSGT